ncbi:hypothetical protein [Pseudonocardia oceani]|uniref:hypothetical protein n=1 Tax=Pseudonocardia oceani TaxID=2792013 RepID=UPI001CEDCC35|nr:hypothetical protein [Pseudonocardia oceani]
MFGEVRRFHIRDDLYLEGGRIDIAALHPVGRLAAEYTLVENVFTTPLEDGPVDVRRGSRIAPRRPPTEFSPIDAAAWSASGAVRD